MSGAIGIIVERTIIRWLYGRMIDTMLATWGLSLFLVGLTTAVFGNTTVGLSAPLGSFEIGQYRTSAYTLFVIGVAIVVLGGVLAVLRFTKLGLIARGTMQNANMAAALGVNPSRVYSITFGVGAALTGLAGAVVAPVSGDIPDHRRSLCRQMLHYRDRRRRLDRDGHKQRRRSLFGAVNQIATYVTTPVFGEVALLAAAIVLIRALPQGITGRFFQRKPLSARALNGLGLALVAVVGLAVLVLVPRLFDLDMVLNVTVYMIMAVLALSLALVWGFGGILCFGQSAFFGLGAYTYAIAMINIGESTVPLILAILVPAAFAALLGYFIFYGRISDVYLGVITLTVTLDPVQFDQLDRRARVPYRLRAGSAASTASRAFPR